MLSILFQNVILIPSAPPRAWFAVSIARPGGSTAVLQVLLALWNAAEHQQAAELLIPKTLEARLCGVYVLAHLCGCSP